METIEICTKVNTIIQECLGVDPNEIKNDSHFLNDLGCDSIMLSEIVMKMEDEFNIRITDQEASTIKTVGDAVKFIEQHLA